MKKTALLLMLLTIFTKVLGFFRDIILSYYFGVSNITDAYLISITIPTSILAFIGTGILTSYIPIYNNIKKDKGVQLANKFTNNIINSLIIISTIVVVIVLLFTNPVVKLFASGFEGETLGLAIKFTRITIFAIYFAAIIYIFNGFLNIHDNFIIPAIGGVPLNVLIIIAIVLSAKFNISILPIGNTLAMGVQLFMMIPFAYKKGYKHNFILDKNDYYLKQMCTLSIPVIIGVSVNQINVLVDRTIASQISIGGISALTYANRLNLFIQSIFVHSLCTALYPMISRMAAEDNIDGLKKSVLEAMTSIILLVIPATIGAMIFAEPVVKLLFGRGAFDDNALFMTSNSLFYYSIGMIGFGLREVLSRVFYSIKDTKTPMLNAAIAMAMNIVLNIILSKYMGIGGLALATSISAIFCTIMLFISFRKKIGSFGLKNIVISFIKVLCTSLIMGIIAKLSYDNLLKHISENLSLVAAIIIGAVVYFVIIYFMGIEEVDSMIKAVKNKLKKSVGNQ